MALALPADVRCPLCGAFVAEVIDGCQMRVRVSCRRCRARVVIIVGCNHIEAGAVKVVDKQPTTQYSES